MKSLWSLAVLLNMAAWLILALAFVLPGEGGFSTEILILLAIAVSVLPVMLALAADRAK